MKSVCSQSLKSEDSPDRVSTLYLEKTSKIQLVIDKLHCFSIAPQ